MTDKPEKKLPKIFCAIDTTDIDHAKALAAAMQKAGCGVKFGLEFFNAHGPQAIKEIMDFYEELPVFLDLKYHDIPNTVAGAMRAIAPLGVDFVNLHASGGSAMMCAAKDALHTEAEKTGAKIPKILGVTILTSLDGEELEETAFRPDLEICVTRLAELAQKSGLDGVVCSAMEIELLRETCGSDFILMVPGIRLEGSDIQDQKRVMTPHAALQKGASYLVIGRPITKADDPAASALDILSSLAA